MDNPTASQAGDPTGSAAEVSVARLPALRLDAQEKLRAPASTIFLVGLALICAATTLTGAVPTRMFGHDTFIPLEIGWRVLHGQRPHVDFVSGWGPVWFLVSALGLAISRHSVDGVGYASAIMALIVSGWSFLLAKARLLPLWRVVFSLFLAALVVAPYPLGNSPLLSSHAMAYNRWGYALLGLVLLECLLPVTEDKRVPHPSFVRLGGSSEAVLGGLSTGAALSLALFLKVSFFLVGAGIAAALALLLRDLSPRRLLGIVVGFGAVSLALLAYLRFDLLAMLRDLRMASAARSAAFTSEGMANKIFSRPSVLLAVLLFAWVAALALRDRAPRWRGWRLPLIGALLFAGDMAIIMTNQQWDGFVLCACFGILMANEIMREQQSEAISGRPLYAGALCLAALLFVPQFTGDLFGLAYGLWSKEAARSDVDIVRLTPPNLAPLVLYDGHIPRSNGRVLATYVNDGVALLERQSRPDETILSIDMTNPFSYALERTPARGGVASPTYHFNIDDEHRPTDDEFFGDAQIVMVPKRPALDDFFYQDFLRAYEPGLHQRYSLAAESSWWWMYRRK